MSTVDWKPTVNREESVLFGYYVLAGVTRPIFADETGLDFGVTNRLVVDHQVYMDRQELATLDALLSEHATERLAGLAERCDRSCDRLLHTARLLSSHDDLPGLSMEEIRRRFRAYSDAVIRHAPFLIATLGAESVLERLVRPVIDTLLLADLDHAEEADAYVRILSPVGMNFISREIDSVAVIANVVAHEPEELQYEFQGDRETLLTWLERERHTLHYLIDQHHTAYCWLNRAYYLGPLSEKPSLIDRVCQRIAEGRDLATVVVERSQRAQVVEAELSAMLARCGADRTFIAQLELYRRYLFLRTHRLDCYSLADHWMTGVLTEVGSRIGVTYDELVWMTHLEIDAALNEKSRVNPDDFTPRRERHAMMLIGGQATIQRDRPAFSLPRPLAPEQLVTEAGLPGTVAFPGTATGIARVVLTPADSAQVQRGDILVAAMTTPDHIAAMERAAAFVTDEGGVACHAALIARDLRTPCLIDTKIATTLIADGDLVQVDSASGHVRILRRADGSR